MKKLLILFLITSITTAALAQHTDESVRTRQLNVFQDSLKKLGKQMFNEQLDLERKNANYKFIKTLVSALKVNNSFYYKFDSVKTVSIINAPDNKFRVFSWFIQNEDGSYRFYGAMQMNTGGPLQMFPFEDYSPFKKNPEDSVYTNKEWYGAQYYSIIPMYGAKKYYVLLGWKGNTVESTKKVIDVISFNGDTPEFGAAIFDGNGKTRKRVVFEYTRQASMMLKYVPNENMIVFDHLAPPDKKLKDKHETYGPDLSYDGYKLKNGRWQFAENLDMKNVPNTDDAKYLAPEPASKTILTKKPTKGR